MNPTADTAEGTQVTVHGVLVGTLRRCDGFVASVEFDSRCDDFAVEDVEVD